MREFACLRFVVDLFFRDGVGHTGYHLCVVGQERASSGSCWSSAGSLGEEMLASLLDKKNIQTDRTASNFFSSLLSMVHFDWHDALAFLRRRGEDYLVVSMRSLSGVRLMARLDAIEKAQLRPGDTWSAGEMKK